MSLRIPCVLVVPRCPVRRDDRDECPGGGDEEGLHGEGEGAEGGEAEVCAVDGCSALSGVSNFLNDTFGAVEDGNRTKARPTNPPVIPPFTVAL